jgi:hypothetical protein
VSSVVIDFFLHLCSNNGPGIFTPFRDEFHSGVYGTRDPPSLLPLQHPRWEELSLDSPLLKPDSSSTVATHIILLALCEFLFQGVTLLLIFYSQIRGVRSSTKCVGEVEICMAILQTNEASFHLCCQRI